MKRTATQHCGLESASRSKSDIIWLQYATCNQIPQFGQCTTTLTKHTYAFLYHITQHIIHHRTEHQNRPNKGQIYCVWINSRGLKELSHSLAGCRFSLTLHRLILLSTILYLLTIITHRKNKKNQFEFQFCSYSYHCYIAVS